MIATLKMDNHSLENLMFVQLQDSLEALQNGVMNYVLASNGGQTVLKNTLIWIKDIS